MPYQVGLIVVAAAMLLLPVVYVALVGALAAGVWYYAVHAQAVFPEGMGAFGRILVYYGPIFAGALAVLFLIKPVFARPPKPPPPLVLSRTDQPLLYTYVEHLCSALGSPAPSEIHVDMQVNASAGFKQGLRGVFGTDLVLTLGLPLVAGLNVSQLSGVFAHEFGHFGQATAMRFSYLIHSVNTWFGRVVYERDLWDWRLDELSAQPLLRPITYFLRFLVWITRRILGALMYAGQAISAYLSRQMEYNADTHQAQVVGSAGFQETYRRVAVCDVATESAIAQANAMWADRRMISDLSALVVAYADKFMEQDENVSALEDEVLKLKTGLLDTHPSVADRIEYAERLGLPSKIACTESATHLFRGFDEVAVRTTVDAYRATFGEAVDAADNVPTEDALSELAEMESSGGAILRVTVGGIYISFGIAPGVIEPEPPASIEDGIAALREARENASSLHDSIGPRMQAYMELVEKWETAETGLLLAAAEIPFTPKELGLPGKRLPELRAHRDAVEEERKGMRQEFVPILDAVRDRVDVAIALAHHPEIRPQLSDGENLLASYPDIAAVLQAMVECWTPLVQLNLLCDHLSILVTAAHWHAGKRGFQQEGERILEEIREVLSQLYGQLKDIDYPFEKGRQPSSVAEKIVPAQPREGAEILDDAIGTRQRAFNLYFRCWGDLARLVDEVDKTLGLPPLIAEEGQGEAEGDAAAHQDEVPR